ncbi:V-type H+-transporting ATPase subunit e [Nematocida sp. AWRm77]|nr:V-type H+-transporting ATPase subunit e [Nematocida sp. AWRm77]
MFKFSAQDHPVLFVLLMGIIVGCVSHIAWTSIALRARFKTAGDRQVVMYSVYLTAACGFLAWACIFLGQVSPMLTPVIRPTD